MSNPENYCSICGERASMGHECDKQTLNRIDGARARDYTQERVPSDVERLKDGFAMLDDDENLSEDQDDIVDLNSD